MDEAMTLLVDNRDLLAAFRAGDKSALSTVYRTYARGVADVLRHGFRFESDGKVLNFRGFFDPLELESFTQDVFLRAFSERARLAYDGLRPYAPYLLRIAKNVVIDELRRRRSAIERLVGPIEEEAEEAASDRPSPEELAEAEAARRLVRTFLATCSDMERRYVRLRFEHDEPLLAAARALGISRMRARWLERRLLFALSQHLRQAGFLESTEGAALLCVGVI